MIRFGTLASKFVAIFRRRKVEQELGEELRFRSLV